MKTANSAANHRFDRVRHTFLRRKLVSSVAFAVSACLLMAASSATAGQPFIVTPPTTAPVAIAPQAQGSQGATANSNQALMSQIITQLNQRQAQLNVTAAQTAARNASFVPQQTFRISHGK